MIDFINQAMVISISIGWAYLGFLIITAANGHTRIFHRIVAGGLFLESFWVLWVGLSRPPYGKTFGFVGLGIALWLVNIWMYRKQRPNHRSTDAVR